MDLNFINVRIFPPNILYNYNQEDCFLFLYKVCLVHKKYSKSSVLMWKAMLPILFIIILPIPKSL